MKITYLSSIAGSGKTQKIIKRAIDIQKTGDNVILLFPSLELIIQCKILLEGLGITHYREISSNTCRQPVLDFCNLLQSIPFDPIIILATHQSFLRLPNIAGIATKKHFHIMVDEEVSILESFEYNLPDSHVLLSGLIEIPNSKNDFKLVNIINPTKLRTISEKKNNDDIMESNFHSLSKHLLSSYWDTYINSYSNTNLKTHFYINFYSVLNPSIFSGYASVTMSCAMFRDTTIFRLWRDKVEFVSASSSDFDIIETHSNGDKISIYYAITDSWSKTLRDRDDRQLFKSIVSAVGSIVGSNDLLVGVNKDIDDNELVAFENHIRLPNTSHGLNTYLSYHNVAFLSARNPTPSYFKFMLFMGIDSEALRIAMPYQQAYQAIMRCSVRDQNSTHLKRIFVPDLPLARYLQTKMPGATIERLPGNWDDLPKLMAGGRRSVHETNADKVATHRSNKELQYLINSHYNLINSRCNEISYIYGENVTTGQFYGTEWPSKYSRTKKKDFIFDNVDDFISMLRCSAEKIIPYKEHNSLISMSYFVQKPHLTKIRGVENIAFVNGIMLDNDGGDLTPHEFSILFNNLHFVAFNSYNSKIELTKFRIYIPTNRPMSSFESAIMNTAIFEKLIKSGYSSNMRDSRWPHEKLHGFDLSKRTPSSLFYMPCKAADPNCSFFTEYNGAGRASLDVDAWLSEVHNIYEQQGISIVESTLPIATLEAVDLERVERARMSWRKSQASESDKGNGNAEFFTLAKELRFAGLAKDQISSELSSEAIFARSPAKRKREIKQLVGKVMSSKFVQYRTGLTEQSWVH